MILALLVIWVILNIMTDGIFFTARNLYNLAVQSSVVGIMATGMVLVIVSRNIDLSVGSLLGFTGMVIAYLQVHVFPLGAAWNWPLTILCGLALGGLVGLWQDAENGVYLQLDADGTFRMASSVAWLEANSRASGFSSW